MKKRVRKMKRTAICAMAAGLAFAGGYLTGGAKGAADVETEAPVAASDGKHPATGASRSRAASSAARGDAAGRASSRRALEAEVARLKAALAQEAVRPALAYGEAPAVAEGGNDPHTSLNRLPSPFGGSVDDFFWDPAERPAAYRRFVAQVLGEHRRDLDRRYAILAKYKVEGATPAFAELCANYESALREYDALYEGWVSRRLLSDDEIDAATEARDAEEGEALEALRKRLWNMRRMVRKTLVETVLRDYVPAGGDGKELVDAVSREMNDNRSDYFW